MDQVFTNNIYDEHDKAEIAETTVFSVNKEAYFI